MNRSWAGVVIATLVAPQAALGQYINDGDFDALQPGTPPNNDLPAGAWGFIESYGPFSQETAPTDLMIVETSSFDPSASGRSLSLSNVDNTPQCVNILPAVIHEQPGRVVRIEFRVWHTGRGGAFYASADMGGGGVSATTDRGPQIRWAYEGYIVSLQHNGNQVVLVPAYPLGVWGRVRLDVRLDDDLFDAYWASGSEPLQLVGSNLAFRAPSINKIDRVTFTPFQYPTYVPVYFDDLTIAVIDACRPDCNADGALTVADFGCFQTKFVAQDMYADCDQNGVLTVADFGCFQTSFVAGCP